MHKKKYSLPLLLFYFLGISSLFLPLNFCLGSTSSGVTSDSLTGNSSASGANPPVSTDGSSLDIASDSSEEDLSSPTASPSTLNSTPVSSLAPTKTEMQSKKDKIEALKIMEENHGIVGKGVLRGLYKNMSKWIEVPGFISLRANRSLGKVVGPSSPENTSFPVNSLIYMRWHGENRPELGEVFSIYTPAVVLQNKNDFTDFKVRQNTFYAKDDLGHYNHAGYFYQSNGEVEIMDISRGVIKGRVIRSFDKVYLNDLIMSRLPRYNNIEEIQSPIRLTAAIVCGSPYDNLSASIGSFIYLNRGKRDGVKVGTVFQTLEGVNLIDASPIKQASDLGEAMVVYASDAYSTAIITKQFNVIRVGALVETLRPGMDRETQFSLLNRNAPKQDKSKEMAEQYISELDKIEKDADILSLSPEERARLEKLHKSDLKRKQVSEFPTSGQSQALPNPLSDAEDDGSGIKAPNLPNAPNLSAARKKREEARKRRKKQLKESERNRDEESLNSLFSQ